MLFASLRYRDVNGFIVCLGNQLFSNLFIFRLNGAYNFFRQHRAGGIVLDDIFGKQLVFGIVFNAALLFCINADQRPLRTYSEQITA